VQSNRPPPPAAPPPNSQFGKYTLVDRLAVGGMAEVFRAKEPRPVGEPRLVVVKRMLPDIAAQSGSRAMFEAESRLGTLIKHDAVVDVLAFGEEGGQPYLVLEYVRGLDLWRLNRFLTRSGKTLGVPLSIFLVRRLLAGLHAVHEARDEGGAPLSVVHRDVSPSNVLLSMHGDVKLGDFGIAYAELRESLPQAAVSEKAKGKLGYLAPEQVTGLDCDRRADVFSTAVIAAELLMGRPLFAGGSELAILLAIRDAKVHPFLEIIDSLPEGLGEIIQKALCRAPEDRIGTALELSSLLAPFEDAPEEELRRELATIVEGGVKVVEAEAHVEATPLLDEDQLDASQPGGLPPGVRPSRELTPVAHPNDPGEKRTLLPAPTTGEMPEVSYQIETAGGMHFGPWSYAQLVEALALGKVGPEDRVKQADGGARRIQDIKSLRRHLAPHNLTPATREQEPPQEATELLPLGDGGIVTALAWAAVRRETGLWLCELGGVRKEVYLKKGTPEFVTSNLASELLGEYLVANAVITRGELDMALAVLPRFEGRLGDTLAALGLVEPIHLFQHIAGQVREKLLDLFLWTGGHATFYEGVVPPPSAFPLDLQPWRIIDEGVDRRIAQGLEAGRFDGRDESVLRQAAPLPQGLELRSLPHGLRTIADALTQPMTLAQLVYSFPDLRGGQSTAVHRSLVQLFHLRAVTWS